MSSQIEDHAIDEDYWRTLLQDVDRVISRVHVPAPAPPPMFWGHESPLPPPLPREVAPKPVIAPAPTTTPQTLIKQLQVGDICAGRVTKLTHFGAFIDLGGYDGLVHVSELSWRRIEHPRDAVSLNQQVQVCVMSIDDQQQRVALSLKRMKPDPWLTIEQRYRPGQAVDGLVSNVVDYGAFIRVEEDLEGLIHASEMGEGNFLHPRSVMKFGERVHAYVLHADAGTRRLALTLKSATK
ncbi:MAG: S1 RNA-binding domain-containing protein [Anaerolineae bacterium]|nr:S1 RNA-binding domain-containing protein [Anaerolineae bacterium]